MSTRSAAGLLAVIACLALPGCAAEAEEETIEGGAAVSNNSVGNTCAASDDAAECLNIQAQKYLKRALAKVEDDLRGQDLLEASEGKKYRVRTTAECFELQNPGAASAAWEQMSGAIEFLSEFHRARRGRDNRWFTDILVCKASHIDDNPTWFGGLWDGELQLAGSTLQVGVKQVTIGAKVFSKVQHSIEIRRRWDAGEHFQGTSFDDEKGMFRERAWPLINPVGTMRMQAVPAIKAGITAFAKALTKIRAIKDAVAQRAELLAAINSNTAVDVDVNGKSFGDLVAAAIDGKSPRELGSLIDKWKDYLMADGAADDAHEAVGAIQQGASGRACNVDIKQICAVAVNNAHCINIRLSVGAQAVSRFIARETAAPQQNTVKATQYSFVCVQTNDFIDIDVNLNPNRALNSAGLANAIGL